jgi:hypothetical protein
MILNDLKPYLEAIFAEFFPSPERQFIQAERRSQLAGKSLYFEQGTILDRDTMAATGKVPNQDRFVPMARTLLTSHVLALANAWVKGGPVYIINTPSPPAAKNVNTILLDTVIPIRINLEYDDGMRVIEEGGEPVIWMNPGHVFTSSGHTEISPGPLAVFPAPLVLPAVDDSGNSFKIDVKFSDGAPTDDQEQRPDTA